MKRGKEECSLHRDGVSPQYIYDGAGRLVQVVAADGSSAIYQYDAAGNITAIQRLNSGDLALTAFSPTSGAPGTQVTLQGTGFSATPGSNAVSFNGTSASVVSASANKLVVQVPSAATTGQISVTVGSNTVNSGKSFEVQAAPTITSFTPANVNVGATVTVSGTNLNPIAGNTQVTVGTSVVPVSSISGTSVSLTASYGSGFIRVRTPFGQATSASPLVVVPASVGSANVVATASLASGGGAQNLTVSQASKYGLFTVEATAGQFLSVQLTSLSTTPGNSSIGYQIISPKSEVVGTGSVSASSPSIHLPETIEGTYLVVFASTSTTTFQLSAVVEVNPAFVGATPSPIAATTTVNSQSKRFYFAGIAGQAIGVAVSSFTASPSTGATVALYQPNGTLVVSETVLPSNPGGSTALRSLSLPQTGNYTVKVTPSGASTMSFTATVSRAITGLLSSRVVKNVSLMSGQFTQLTFAGIAGGDACLTVDTVATTPSGQNLEVHIIAPNGTDVANSFGGGTRQYTLSNLQAGTYTVLMYTWYGVPVTANVTAVVAAAAGGTVSANGSSTSFATTVPGQSAQITFAGTAGQGIGVGLLNFTASPSGDANVQLLAPNGSLLAQTGISPSNPGGATAVSSLSLPSTGNYTIRVIPVGVRTMSFSVKVSQAVTGTLTSGTAQGVSLINGQFALLTFTASAGQDAYVVVDTVATTPSGQNLEVHIYAPNGTDVANSYSTGTRNYTLSNLQAGTYKVHVYTWYGVPASANITATIGNPAGGSVAANGSSNGFSTVVPGQTAQITFSGTAGQAIGVGLANFTASPSAGATVSLYDTNGSLLTSTGISPSNPGGATAVRSLSLPQTGTYTIRVVPGGTVTMGFDLVVSQAATGSLSFGTPQNVSLILGQLGQYSFAATANQNVSVTVDTVSTTPSGQNLEVHIYNPSGSDIANSSATGTRTYNLTSLPAGTYKVVLTTWYGVPVSARVTAN